MERNLYSGLASAFTVTEDFDFSQIIGGITVYNESDIDITLELKSVRLSRVADVLDPSDNTSTISVTIPAGTDKFFGLGELPNYNWYRFTGDGSAATTGDLIIFANAECVNNR